MAEKDIVDFSRGSDSIAIGPGMSQNRETQKLIRNIVGKFDKPVILDADGINAFVGHLDALKGHGCALVLTPHAGEMARLVGKDVREVQENRKDIALGFAALYNTVLVLKGHNTVVASADGKLYINDTGNAGMASGGVGDVLTGMTASFAGQGLDLFSASALAVYFHGLAGDLAAKEKGVLSLVATDILNKLPEALKMLG
jgi:NAD(P)H-hydrate epimerase